MNFSDFAALCYTLEKTPSRLAKIAEAADYLRRLESDEIRPGVAFLSGRPFPVSDPRTLDIGAGAFSHAAEVPENDVSVLPPLKISDVANIFAQIAEASGKGSREQKYSRLRELIEMASAHERPILFRLLHNELRIGLHDGLIQEAIARASGSDLKTVRRAALFLSDLAEVAVIALTDGADGLQQVDIKLFVPLLPMLSELSEDFDEIIKTHNGETALEYKYDGARVQIHKDRDQVRIWSRRLTEVTESLPEIAEIARNHLRGDSFILDAEVVATGSDGRPFPFQELMRVYFEKPRTTVGWKGLINDPNLDGSFRINDGLRVGRQLLLELNESGMLAAVLLMGAGYLLLSTVDSYTMFLVIYLGMVAHRFEKLRRLRERIRRASLKFAQYFILLTGG